MVDDEQIEDGIKFKDDRKEGLFITLNSATAYTPTIAQRYDKEQFPVPLPAFTGLPFLLLRWPSPYGLFAHLKVNLPAERSEPVH